MAEGQGGVAGRLPEKRQSPLVAAGRPEQARSDSEQCEGCEDQGPTPPSRFPVRSRLLACSRFMVTVRLASPLRTGSAQRGVHCLHPVRRSPDAADDHKNRPAGQEASLDANFTRLHE